MLSNYWKQQVGYQEAICYKTWCCLHNGSCLIPAVVNGQHAGEEGRAIYEFQICFFLTEFWHPRRVTWYTKPTPLIMPQPFSWSLKGRFWTVHNLGRAVLITHRWRSTLRRGQQRLCLRILASGLNHYFFMCIAKNPSAQERKQLQKESKKRLESDVPSKWTGKKMLLLLWQQITR